MQGRRSGTAYDAIDKYIKEILPFKRPRTIELQKSQLKWFKDNFGQERLKDLNNSTLIKIRCALKNETISIGKSGKTIQRSGATVNRYFNPLLNCLNIAKNNWGWIRTVPKLKGLSESNGRTRFLTPNEIEALKMAIDNEPRRDVRLVCQIGMLLGSRLNETCSLRWQDVNLEQKLVTFSNTKNGLPKCLPLPDFLVNEITLWRDKADKDCPYLFPVSNPAKASRPYIYSKVRKNFERIIEKLKLPEVTFHTLRHTVASLATQEGFNRKMVGEVLGHQDLRTTDRYSHLNADHLRPCIERVEAIVVGEKKNEVGAKHETQIH